MKINGLLWIAVLGMILLSFPACGDWIYDKDDGEIGGVTENSFTMINATQYTHWAYINLEAKTAEIIDHYSAGSTGIAPDQWHFAMHRFDCKTNGGQVLETSFSTIDDLIAYGSLPQGEFVKDELTDDRVAYDMTNMMEGIIIYAESDYNVELSKWMDVDLCNMPPIYTPSNRVYLIRFADTSIAALRFTDFVGPMSVKGYVSFEYVYPLEF